MLDPKTFYQGREAQYSADLSTLKGQITRTSSLRLIVFLLAIGGMYWFRSETLYLVVIFVIGTAGFVYLLLQHQSLKLRRDITEALVEINRTELKVLEENYADLAEGNEFIDAAHFFSYDIDLFGPGSFFQYINRTATRAGKELLAKLLTENQHEEIHLKQEVLKELAEKPDWMQRYRAIAVQIKTDQPAQLIARWISEYKSTFKKPLKWLPQVVSMVSLVLIGLTVAKVLSAQFVLIWFFIGLVISAYHFKKVTALYQKADRSKAVVKQYHQLLKHIESENFEAENLKKHCDSMGLGTDKATVIFAQFSKLLDAFDQRNNVFVALLGNAFFLRDIHLAIRIENWIEKHAHHLEHWFEVIAFFDAYNSLATFVFNHPSYSFPIVESNKGIAADQLSHPLLKKDGRVANDFYIEAHQFFIVTGANMAGKSTFLRSVSLAIVMANIGLPVCAKSFRYSPLKLLTSMRTTDSLAHDESYFYAELKRLKFVVEALHTDRYFVILDEILKGTNSQDKTKGSIKFVERLITLRATGLIATHDLSLCTIEDRYDQVKNYYFAVDMKDDSLHFDYQLRPGVCKNMNATFLLKQMKIVD